MTQTKLKLTKTAAITFACIRVKRYFTIHFLNTFSWQNLLKLFDRRCRSLEIVLPSFYFHNYIFSNQTAENSVKWVVRQSHFERIKKVELIYLSNCFSFLQWNKNYSLKLNKIFVAESYKSRNYQQENNF